jgi:hypothetical protein
MEIHISSGEWANSLMSRMNNAADGDLFCLPTPIHEHIFWIVKNASFPERQFKVEVKESQLA